MARSIRLRVTLVKPPSRVSILQQEGKSDLVPPSSYSDEHISFDFTVSISNEPSPTAPPNFRGSFVQGPPTARFTYINSGTYAGEHHSAWGRRAKVPLSGITWELIEEVLAKPGQMLEGRIAGMAKDGGPACATVPLLDGGWKLIKSA